jgi:alpha-beta hydrolase superfamily lysophospholipase
MKNEVIAASLRVDVSDVAPTGCRTVVAEVFTPAGRSSGEVPAAVFCFPGGGMSRRYFDLPIPGYSLAEHLGALGYMTVIVDHPGVGESEAPDDPWTLTPEVVADVDAAVVARVMAVVGAGQAEGLPAVRPSAVVGVGHSAGAMVVIYQQARRRPFDAVALLGWAGHGLPEHLDDTERQLAAGSERLPAGLVAGARRRHKDPLLELPRGSSSWLLANTMAEDVRAALVGARSPLLAVVGFASMIPGCASRAAAQVAVPVFLGVGEHDIAVDHHRIPAEFPASGDVTLFVLEGAGHNHNVEPRRAELWDRLAGWVSCVTSRRPASDGLARESR